MQQVKSIAKLLLPPILAVGTKKLKKLFSTENKKDRHISIGKYPLIIPYDHILNHVLPIQPYRNLAVGITAKAAVKNLPGSMIIDIGANVGDTAAVVATYCENELILVEPSSRYRAYLSKNASAYPGKVTILDCFISGKIELRGELVHENGSARVVDSIANQHAQPIIPNHIKKLSEITDRKVAFVKIDADGYDYDIILSSQKWLADVRPVLYFEVEISGKKDLAEAVESLDSLSESNFTHFIVWDDAGFCIAAETPLSFEFLKKTQRSMCI